MHSASGFDRIEVVTGIERRRRWSLGEKLKAVEETRSSGMSVSYVARKYGISPSLLFRWRKLMTEGGKEAIRTDDAVVSAAEVRELKSGFGSWSECWARRPWRTRFSRRR
jgi:transposase